MTQVPNVGPAVQASGQSEGGGTNGKESEGASGFEGILGGLIATQATEIQPADPGITGTGPVADGATEAPTEAQQSGVEQDQGSREGAEVSSPGEQSGDEDAASEAPVREGDAVAGEQVNAEQAGEAAKQGESAQVIASVLSAAAEVEAGEVLNIEAGVTLSAAEGLGSDAGASEPLQAAAADLAVDGQQQGDIPAAIETQEAVTDATVPASPQGEVAIGEASTDVAPAAPVEGEAVNSEFAELNAEVVSQSEGAVEEGAVEEGESIKIAAGKANAEAESTVASSGTEATGPKGDETVLDNPDRGEVQAGSSEMSPDIAKEEIERTAGAEEFPAEKKESASNSKPVVSQEGPMQEAEAAGDAREQEAPEIRSAAPEAKQVETAEAKGSQEATAAVVLGSDRPEATAAAEVSPAPSGADAMEVLETGRSGAASLETSAPERAAQPASSSEVEPQREVVMDQVVRSARMNLEQGNSRFELRLQPPTLGRMGVTMDLKDGALSISFRVENDAVRELLQSSMPQLRAALTEQGVSIDGLDVHNFGREAGEQQATGGNGSGAGRGAAGGEGVPGDLADAPVVSGVESGADKGALDYWA